MNRSMVSSSISMQGLQQKLDIIAHNIANSNTPGFKRKEASFHDILTTTMQQPDEFRQDGRLSPMGFTQGWGAKIGQIQMDMSQGSLQMTENPLDFAIEGDALFEVQRQTIDEAGNIQVNQVWTKEGSFSFSTNPEDPDNVYLTTKDGDYVVGYDVDGNEGPMRVPKNHRIQVDTEGNIMAYNEIQRNQPPTPVGQLKIVHVIRPHLLDQIGDKLFVLQNGVDNADGEVLTPMNEILNNRPEVSIRQGFIEHSNVNLTSEMTELIQVQRAFQLNARALSSSDTMMNLTNNLRG